LGNLRSGHEAFSLKSKGGLFTKNSRALYDTRSRTKQTAAFALGWSEPVGF
jgi:hypothetical protein